MGDGRCHGREEKCPERNGQQGAIRGGDPLRLDPISRVLTWGAARVRLPPAHAFLMALLITSAPGELATRDIWRHLWGDVPVVPTSAARTLIYRLRKICRATFDCELIDTVLGRGYALRVPAQLVHVTGVTKK